jgi:hypothetical protein
MSTLLHDLDSQAEFAVGFPPTTVSDSDVGTAIDMAGGDGPVFAVLLTGGLDPGTGVSIAFEESHSPLSGWAAIPSSSTPSTSAAEAVTCVSFSRTKRYVRCLVNLTGTAPQAAVAVLVGQQRKVL